MPRSRKNYVFCMPFSRIITVSKPTEYFWNKVLKIYSKHINSTVWGKKPFKKLVCNRVSSSVSSRQINCLFYGILFTSLLSEKGNWMKIVFMFCCFISSFSIAVQFIFSPSAIIASRFFFYIIYQTVISLTTLGFFFL